MINMPRRQRPAFKSYVADRPPMEAVFPARRRKIIAMLLRQGIEAGMPLQCGLALPGSVEIHFVENLPRKGMIFTERRHLHTGYRR